MKIFQKGKLKKLERPFRANSGAWVLFEGTVRSPNNNKKVRFINYEVYEEMLESEGSKIAKQAEGKWDIKEIIIKHGSGKIKPKERSIQIGILAPHRKEAFEAAEWVLEECKKRLPVWKEEIN
ncbi:molybdenum cofactor biosynthesis protein MoaE [bacterium]|nr:molybdenum cofactor biosynthesis protein MoaE [bacterium]|tara:strand:- start:17314 stop:17682 length:369 start_codon:yes stop_codon:yes gene_type:complete